MWPQNWFSLSHADHSSLFPPQPDCHLHLHLRWADNPYVSGTVHTKDTAPGLIMGAGGWLQRLLQPEGIYYLMGRNWGHAVSIRGNVISSKEV